jgi:hypothetical protein
MTELRKDNNDGKILANSTKVNETAVSRRQCWNCGSPDHEKWNCDVPSHECKKCGKSGHLERFCRNQRPRGERPEFKREDAKPAAKKPMARPGENGKRKFYQKSGKSNSRTRALKKIIAHLIDLEDDDQDDDADLTPIPEDDNFADGGNDVDEDD